MLGGDIYVVQDGDEWKVTVEGTTTMVLHYDTRREAVETGRRVAGSARSRLLLLGTTPEQSNSAEKAQIAA